MTLSDIATTGSNPPALWAGGTWEDLTRDAYEVFGADLEAGAQLIGVPMCLIMATFRQGDYADKNGVKGFYVSLDTIIGPQGEIAKAVRRKRIPEDVTPPEPGEHLVFNEGGTGVYRQIVSYLEETGRIRITSDLPREGAYGESRLDIPPSAWDVDQSADFRKSPDGQPSLAFSLRILCPRGLRSSEYANDYSKAAVTRYIA
jgi:hypothetical protein